jgi:hypothetical protein
VVNAPAGKLIRWNSISYASLAKFTVATGQEAHGIQAQGGFADPARGYLTLTPGSPAIDSGYDGSLTTPAGNAFLPDVDVWGNRYDDPATPNTGAGLVTYLDRGAFEMDNYGFEVDTAEWSNAGSSSGVSETWVPDGHLDPGAVRLLNTSTAPATCLLQRMIGFYGFGSGTFEGAGTYSATLWVRADNPGATLTLTLSEWVNHYDERESVSTVPLTTEWQPVTVEYAELFPPGSTSALPTYLNLEATVAGVPHGTCFYADDASVAVG